MMTNVFDDATTVRELLSQLIGYALASWPQGEFDATQAIFTVEQAEERLKEIQSNV